MRKILSVFVIALAVSMIYSSAVYAWPWDKKAGAQKEAKTPPKKTTAANTRMPEQPKIVIPKIDVPKIPQIVIPTQANTNTPPPNISMEMITGELVSAKKKDDNTVILTIKKADGTEFTVEGDARLSIARTVPIAEVAPGEKITAHCIVDKDKNQIRAIHIIAGIAIPPNTTPRNAPKK